MGCCQFKTNTELENITLNDVSEITYTFKKCKILSVYDGDTYWVAAKFNNNIYKFHIRLYGVDCPELNTVEGKLAKQYVSNRILNRIVDIDVLTNTRVYDRSKKGRIVKGKYGRLLAKIYIDNKLLSNELIHQNLAVEYYGGTK